MNSLFSKKKKRRYLLNKKGSMTIILFGIVFFNAFLLIMYGAYGKTARTYGIDPQTQIEEAPDINEINGVPFLKIQNPIGDWYESKMIAQEEKKNEGWIDFIKNIGFGFKETPVWLSILLFIPINMLLVYLVYKSIRGGGD